MSKPFIHPFAALCVNAHFANTVISPPYDVVSVQDVQEALFNTPDSFLAVTRPDVQLATTDNQPQDQGKPKDPLNIPNFYRQGAFALHALLEKQALEWDKKPAYYLYRLTTSRVSQLGIAAAIDIDAYEQERVAKHEKTRPDKEDDRTQHILTVQAHTGPVLLFYQQQNALTEFLLDWVQQHAADIAVNDKNQVRHEIWRMQNKKGMEHLQKLLAPVEKIYIADGHHRAMAAKRAKDKNLACQRFLGVVFPAEQLQILGYHRLITDFAFLDAEQFLKFCREHFAVEATPKAFLPRSSQEFGMVMAGNWYRLTVPIPAQPKNLIESLPASILSQEILSPLLKITDPRTDPRIQYIGGLNACQKMCELTEDKTFAVGFTIAPVTTQQIAALADQGGIMPPKSTWFEPKLADGLLTLSFK